jgi:hypothetical protein
VNQPLGFDLEAADWVAPYGKGNVPDFIFTFTETVPFVDDQRPFDAALTITFSNKGDGILSVPTPINGGSELRLPRYAPESGFESTLVKHIGRAAKGQPLETDVRDDENYLFRVRTVMNGTGHIKSALYGKIDGDINVWENRRLRFKYYLNPMPNDRNMEFDPERNLFGRLPFNDAVTAP